MPINIGIEKNQSLGKISGLIVPFIWFFVLIIISYFVAKAGYAKIQSQRAAVVSARKTENVLVEKESELNRNRQVYSYVKPVSIALPDRNPALVLISQIRNLSALNVSTLTDLRIGGMAGADTISKVSISFSLNGSYADLMSFLKDTKSVSPLLTIQKVDFSSLDAMALVDVILSSYWSPYPEKLPPITEPIQKFTNEDLNILGQVSGNTLPVFSTLTPLAPFPRENPFF
ncbi:hypothetical protein A2W13_00560 [Candidatus Woesebacteria bacterium RBG_16_36_11]|uniref:Uncharacterized protein n=3 Tax=Candidatus Woeseibacteriota TaxID=1752722 RepID=A0A1F7X767_9BACT|nr:MAG: hypothetical protein A2Z67_01230 [Candidatus Woesebacteria bacterium RBG_13_36_22]OGM10920.1 MAG: hypothetical protein A2W13_00560 [Candidatus Woesebacteria bacterium RBG_16_36_11]OGM16890.1 MAG: hypothetical protein A2V55_02955 [Candidatus Woesebacteria bacterium RBG_19FT_COMBO_37_29]